MFVSPGEFLEFLVYDRAGAPSATKHCPFDSSLAQQCYWLVRRGAFVGCSDPLFGQLLAQLLPPTGTGVLHVCSSVSSLCCTWVSWPERDVVHSDTVRQRTATSVIESWVPPAVVASAVLHSAQTQGRVAQIGAPQRDVPGPVLPKMCEAAPCGAKAAPNLDVNATPTVSVPADASVLPVDPNLAGLLEKVTGLKERLSARRSLGGLSG